MDDIRFGSDIDVQLSDQWERLGISSDFIFCKVMQDEGLLSELIRRILPDLEFVRLEIQPQKAIDVGADIHGVRFDIFVTLPDERVIDIEMQMLDQGSLPKRIRYYGSMADMQILDKGEVYSRLPDSYVIIICCFDHFKAGRHVYTFTNICHEDPEIRLEDGCTKIVLNATGTMDDVDPKLKAFLDYVAGKKSDDEYIRKLDNAVHMAKANKDWRREFMTLVQRDLENQEIGGIREREKGVKAVVELCKSFGGSSLDAVEKIVANMGVSQAEADRLVSKYW